MSHHRSLNLTQLNPETTNLHLIINPTHILNLTIPIPPHTITRAIHPGALLERASHKTLRRQTHTTHIPPRHTRTRHIQLTHH
ncbi:hypothetical protein ACFVW2_36545, partial [Streptomyces sp. NPDC058171]